MKEENIKKVRAMLLRNGKIAVIESKRSGAYMLPGGKVEGKENDETTLTREISEELGIDIKEEDIEGPFLTRKTSCKTRDEVGNEKEKNVITNFYIASTEQDINFSKMNLTPREKARGSMPYWINPSRLEYFLNKQVETFENGYAKKYASEYLSVYKKFREVQKSKKRKELEK